MNNTPYRLIKTERARKTGEGCITYAVLKDADSQGIYFIILANDGAGQFSSELVSFDKIEQCLAKVQGNKPVAAKLFATVFVGRSSNNPGFLQAALRQEYLLMPAADASHLHTVTGNWAEWKRNILAQEGQPYTPLVKGAGVVASTTPADTKAKPEPPAQETPIPEADSAAPKGKKSRKLLILPKKPAEPEADAVDSAESSSMDTEAASHDDAA